MYIQDLISSKDEGLNYIKTKDKEPREGKIGKCIDSIDIFWNTKLKLLIYMIGFYLFLIFSILIIMGEISLVEPTFHYFFSPLGKLAEGISHSYLSTFVTNKYYIYF